MKSTAPILSLTALSLLLLSGCSWFKKDEDAPLPGTRVSVLQLQKDLEPVDPALKTEGFIAPAPWKNEFWPQAGGYANHSMQNLDLNPNELKKIWSTDIGTGSDSKLPLTAEPVILEGVVFTLDTHQKVTAFEAKSGKKIWSNSIAPLEEDDNFIGGGLAASVGTLYATNGYNELLALNSKTGGIYWRVPLTAPARSAPTVMGNQIYVLSLDNRLTAFNADDGKVLWDYQGYSETASLLGSASPAADSELVLAPLSSGELAALQVENGSTAWNNSLSSTLQASGAATLPDIVGLPIIDKDVVFATSYGGRFAAIDKRTGQVIWQQDIGAAKTPWICGNMLFFITSDAQLVAMGRDTGALVWVKPLSTYDAPEQSRNPLLWHGPVMAGNRLIVTSQSGSVMEIKPEDGTLLRKLKIGSRVAVPPVIADSTLYLLGSNGTLSAWK